MLVATEVLGGIALEANDISRGVTSVLEVLSESKYAWGEGANKAKSSEVYPDLTLPRRQFGGYRRPLSRYRGSLARKVVVISSVRYALPALRNKTLSFSDPSSLLLCAKLTL